MHRPRCPQGAGCVASRVPGASSSYRACHPPPQLHDLARPAHTRDHTSPAHAFALGRVLGGSSGTVVHSALPRILPARGRWPDAPQVRPNGEVRQRQNNEPTRLSHDQLASAMSLLSDVKVGGGAGGGPGGWAAVQGASSPPSPIWQCNLRAVLGPSPLCAHAYAINGHSGLLGLTRRCGTRSLPRSRPRSGASTPSRAYTCTTPPASYR